MTPLSALATTPAVISDSAGNAATFTIGDDGRIQGPIVAANSVDQIGSGGYGNALGDFDNDGVLDYLVDGAYAYAGWTRPIPSYTWFFMELHRGSPAGTYAAGENAIQTISENYGGDLAVGDFNEDGILDVAANAPNFAQVYVYFGSGNGAYTGPLRYSFTNNITAYGLDAADVNGDGHLDLVTSRYSELTSMATMHFMVLLGDGRGGFTKTILAANTPNNAVTQTWGTACADFDGDGRADLVGSILSPGTDKNLLLFYKGNGDGTFQTTPILTGVTAASYATAGLDDGDFDHDGRRDLIVAAPQLGGVLVMFGNGDGTFTASPQGVVPAPFGAVAVSTLPASPAARPASVLSTSAARLDFSATAYFTAAPTQTLTITSPSPVAWTASTNTSWLRVSASSGTTPATITVTADYGGLASDVYGGGITLSAPGYANRWVPVVFAVHSMNAFLTLSKTLLTFSAPSGGANPASQSFDIQNFGGNTLNWTASSGASWLSAGLTSGSGPTTMPVSVNTAGLAPGTYGAAITVNATNSTGATALNSPLAIWVWLTVTPPVPTIATQPASLSFTAVEGTSPASQSITVTNAGVGSMSWSATTDASWLSAAPSSGSAPGATTVSVDSASLAAGTYTGNVTITSAGATNTPLVVPVALTVASQPPTIAASPAALSFSAVESGASPATQTLTISNAGGGTLAWSAVTDASWLSVGAASGAAPASIAVDADVRGLAAGTYTAQITVTSAGATNTPFTVPVTFVVATRPPTIAVSATSLAFTATANGASPAAQTLTITNGDGGTLAWTASSDSSWLTATPSGTAPSSASVSINTAGLGPGSYAGTLTLTAAGATNTPVRIAISLVVNAAPVELLVNGGLESGTTSWGRGGVATWASTAGQAHGGVGYVYWNDTSNALGVLAQQFAIPSGTTSASFSAWMRVSTTETATWAADRLFVEVLSSSGATLATLATFSNLDAATMGSWTQVGPWDLSRWAGQTIRVQLRVLTSGSAPTTFSVDDLSVH